MLEDAAVEGGLPEPIGGDVPDQGLRRRVGDRGEVIEGAGPADPDQLGDEPGGVVNVLEDLGAEDVRGDPVGERDRVCNR